MTYSMTAFARIQNQNANYLLCWELKSVNHRYLEVSFRLPESFRALELNLRNQLREQVNRGKLECQLKVTDLGVNGQTIAINESLTNALLAAGEKLAHDKQIANDLTVSNLLTWPGIVQTTQPDTDSLFLQTEQLFKEALQQLLSARRNEGNALKEYVKARLDKLKIEIQGARGLAHVIQQQAKDKLLHRLAALQIEVADLRVEQELAFMITKLDVSEELDRLESHVGEVLRTLEKKEAVGRRLDFLMQELNREANTLGSKSDSIDLTQHAVEMKVLIEQMREQIQNIE